MEHVMTIKAPSRLVLGAETAADLMTKNPISVRERATLKEAIAFLTDKGIRAVPVVDSAGRLVGVLSQTDIVIHDRNIQHLPSITERYAETDMTAPSGETLSEGFRVESNDGAEVRDIMTPVVLSVSSQDSVTRVVGDMLALKVHRLFVVDDGVLVGVISAFDVLRKLRVEK